MKKKYKLKLQLSDDDSRYFKVYFNDEKDLIRLFKIGVKFLTTGWIASQK